MLTTKNGTEPGSGTRKPDGETSADETRRRIAERMQHLEEALKQCIANKAEQIYNERLRTGAYGNEESDWLEAERQVCEQLESMGRPEGANNSGHVVHA